MLSSKKRKSHTRQQPSAILASWGFQSSRVSKIFRFVKKNKLWCQRATHGQMELSNLTNHSMGFCEAMLWQEIWCESVLRRNGFFFVVLISFVLVDTCSFKIGKKFGSVQKIWQLFQIGGYTYSTNTDFLLKQTNKGVEWLRPNTEYCALNFLLCFVHYFQLDKSTSSELVREWLRWANIILVFIFMWSHGPTFVAERQSK